MFGIDDAIIGAGLTAGATALSNYFSNRTNRDIAGSANAQTAYQAQLNRDFQERMSNTSWQRGVADMKAAGINPMLAFSRGGASTPAGSSAAAVVGAPQQPVVSNAVNSGIAALRAKADLANLHKQNELIDAQSFKALQEARTAGMQGTLLQNQIPASDFKRDLDMKYGHLFAVLDRVSTYGNSAAGMAQKILNSLPRGIFKK